MKKSNVIITAVLAVASILLLCLWFFLGFNKVDPPLDLILSIVWWVIIAAGAGFVFKTESTRRSHVRTVFVGNEVLFNSEAGLVNVGGTTAVNAAANILGNLEYDFTSQDAPEDADWRYVVRTEDYKLADDEAETWTGTVINVATGNATPFSSRSELAGIIG